MNMEKKHIKQIKTLLTSLLLTIQKIIDSETLDTELLQELSYVENSRKSSNISKLRIILMGHLEEIQILLELKQEELLLVKQLMKDYSQKKKPSKKLKESKD